MDVITVRLHAIFNSALVTNEHELITFLQEVKFYTCDMQNVFDVMAVSKLWFTSGKCFERKSILLS